MHNRTTYRCLESSHSAAEEGWSCLAFAKSKMNGLDIAPKEKFSIQPSVCSGIRDVLANVVMVDIDMNGKSSSRDSIYEIT